MKLLGYSGHEFVKIGFASVAFILVLKWLAPKTGIPALAATTERI